METQSLTQGKAVTSSFELTNSQRLLWIGQQLNPDKPIYNMALTFEFSGTIDVNRFKQAFQTLVRHSDAMRTVFGMQSGSPVQNMLPEMAYEVEFIDWAALAEPDSKLEQWRQQRSQQTFDLSRCLFDSVLIRMASDRYIWFFNQHHLVIDAWGVTLQYKALAALYRGMGEQAFEQSFFLPLFSDYLALQKGLCDRPQNVHAANYWQQKLKELPGPTVFYGCNKVRPDSFSKRVFLDLGKDRSEALRQLARNPEFRSWTEHLSLFNIFSTLLFAYLYRVSGQQKLAIGTPAHNRATTVEKKTPGLFIEIFPLLAELDPMETFSSLFQKVRNEINGFLKNAQTGASSPELSRGYNVILNYINTSFSDFNGIPMTSTWIHPDHADPGHHLRLQVHDFDAAGTIQLHFDLNTSIFDTALQQQAPTHFMRLLDSFLQDRTELVGKAPLVNEPMAFKGPVSAHQKLTVLESFENCVIQHPSATAIYFENAEISYKQLNEEANQLAHFLLDHGVQKGDHIAIYLHRAPEFVVGVLAVLKAGGAFVPIPSNYPTGRVLGIVEDAQAKLVLSTSSFIAGIHFPPGNVIQLDLEHKFIAQQKNTNPGIQLQPDDLAYLMYTSGSTGLPKGVMIAHRALSHYIFWARKAYDLGTPPVMPLFTSIGFDLTITSLFLPFVAGGTLAIYPEASSGPDLALFQVIADNRVNLIKMTPSHLALLKGQEVQDSKIRAMIVGGENLKTELVRSITDQFTTPLRIYNEYGPTEATVGCVVHEYDPADDLQTSVPIGWPISDTVVYILDEFEHPVPQGVTGELYISGRGLAEGYWRQEELSKAQFIENPFTPGTLMYRTGDLARLHRSGLLEYLGRKDQQVKIGSRRVELEEISNALVKHPAVQNAVIALRRRGGPKIPESIHYCVRCGLPSNYPAVKFDEQGVCHLCLAFKNYQNKVQKYFKNMPDLEALFAGAGKKDDREYDCIMLLSGGKDSTYALARLVEMNVKVLAFTLDNGYISEQAKGNIRRVVQELGVDHIFGETPAMNAIFVDSLERHHNVCDGCFKTIYTLSIQLALEKNIPFIVTGLSRGQFFETRLTEELFRKEAFDPNEIDEIILQARKAYHRVDDAVKRLLDVSMFENDQVFEQVQFLDFYRYCDVSLDEMLAFLDERIAWVRPTDTGRSTNCLINKAGIYVHKKEMGYSNYAFPYSWDVRVGHKTREASLEEINEEIGVLEVEQILDEIGYTEAQKKDTQSAQLVAYYSAPTAVDEQVLRNFLLTQFPDYMVPIQYLHLDTIPLTINGKVDVDALPQPEAIRPQMEVAYVAPQNDIEEIIAEIWSDILGIERIGVFDNFVQLGGDSLSGIRLMARINEAFELDLPINIIFEKMNIASQASYINETIIRLLAELDSQD